MASYDHSERLGGDSNVEEVEEVEEGQN